MRPFRWPIRILSPKAKYTPVNVHKTVSLLVRLHRSSAGHERDHTSISLQANRPGHWSQSFSRSYGSNLPTSLTYIILSTRGCSPWRPAADIGTITWENETLLRLFKGQAQHSRCHRNRGTLRKQRPYLRMNRFQGVRSLTRDENSSSVLERRYRVRMRYRADDSKSRNRYMQVREY